MDEGKAQQIGPAAVLGWAAFLACSWTWCIGMYLPVILVRDMGLWGWIVFAVPNVIGAAAMGWVVADRERSQRLVERHRGACAAFSVVTIAFHAFFLPWFLIMLLVPAGATAVMIVLAGSVVLMILVQRGRPFAAASLGISLAAFAIWLALVDVAETHRAIAAPFSVDALFALFLLPVSMFGFLLCPYLDLTFHRARQAMEPAAGRFAFTFGFGVLFLLMILFSLYYAPALIATGNEPNQLMGIVLAHVVVQTFFTLRVHAVALRETLHPMRMRAAAVPLVAAALLVILPTMGVQYRGIDSGEIIYRCFMGFYALVFPAYVWLCMIPTRDGHAGPRRDKVRVLAFAVGVALPMFWLGFIEGRMAWLLPGVLVVLASRLVLRARARQ